MTEEEFWAALQPIEEKKVFYRLYYNEQGFPLYFSQEDLPGNYIEIDRETFVNPPKFIRVMDGKLIIYTNEYSVTKLRPNKYGTPCHPQDVSIVVEKHLPHTNWNIV
jgi:hypothetical protein